MAYQLRAATNMLLLPPSGELSAEWHHRKVDRPVTIIFPQKGFRVMQQRAAQILRGSEGDTISKSAAPREIAETFYIQLDEEDLPVIPCWAIRMTSSAIYAHFHKQLTRAALDRFEEAFAIRAELESLLAGADA